MSDLKRTPFNTIGAPQKSAGTSTAVRGQEFVRNFYRARQSKFSVEPLTIKWDAVPQAGNSARLPTMRVDVFLRGSDRRIIIDTKYYANALQTYHGVESIHSGNLYQLFSYLRNVVGGDSDFLGVEGMLLYPCAGTALDERFDIQGHPITIATVNLATQWFEIEGQLLTLIHR